MKTAAPFNNKKDSIFLFSICLMLMAFIFILLATNHENYFTPKGLSLFMGVTGIFMIIVAGSALRHDMKEKYLKTRLIEYEKSQKEIKNKNLKLEHHIQAIKEIQKKLENSERKYKTIVNGVPEGYFETDLKGRFLFFNNAFCNLVRQSPENLLNLNFRDFVPKNSSIKLFKAFNEIYNRKKNSKLMEHNFFNEQGEMRVHELSVSLIEDHEGHPTGFKGVVRDVTERQNSTIAIRESEERLKNIINSINAGIVIIEPENHCIVEANPAAINMIGGKMEDIIGSICHRFICPAERGECPITDLGKKVENAERVLIDMSGNEIDIMKSVLEIEFNGKKHLLESFIDISEFKKVQKELKASKEAAENANKTKSEFLANMSHELRTPLNHIIGFSELVLDPSFGELNETQEEYIRDIHESSAHLLSLINDILDLSKVEAGKMELEASTVAIKNLIENSLVMIREKAVMHGIGLSIEMDGIPETITADERKIKQILYNLLSNSIKFTPDKGRVSICATLLPNDNPDVVNKSMIKISVSDTGVGIAPENIHRVFNYFEQVENTSTKKYQGTGIGLALTRRLVELHKGRIWVESDGKDLGSTFSFTIPA